MKRVIISDLHIGSAYCKEEELLQFLNGLECDELILAGDIVDFVKVPIFSEYSMDILHRMASFPSVVYIIGNHDFSFDAFAGKELNQIRFMEEYVFTDSGRAFRVEHNEEIKTYVNTGDWVEHMTYVTVVDGIVRLKNFKKELDKDHI